MLSQTQIMFSRLRSCTSLLDRCSSLYATDANVFGAPVAATAFSPRPVATSSRAPYRRLIRIVHRKHNNSPTLRVPGLSDRVRTAGPGLVQTGMRMAHPKSLSLGLGLVSSACEMVCSHYARLRQLPSDECGVPVLSGRRRRRTGST